MLSKALFVEVDESSWRSKSIPSWISGSPSTHDLDMKKALLMLGTLTLPSLISPASPARTWAWIRYFLAIANSTNFRITRDFSELDPHQKGILSDDLGVALSTQWLFDRLGGFQDIVDGRRFMLQFPDLLRKRTNARTAKVGPTKAPDYVVLDKAGKWHVLECKGTQTGPRSRDNYLNDALSQKQVILMKGALRGEQLAVGLSISHEDQRRDSSLRVVDPEVDPILTLDSEQEVEIKSKINRLSMARALGIVGLNDASTELSLPPDVLKGKEYLQGTEKRRARSTAQARSARGLDQLRSRELARFSFESREYEGRTALIELPELSRNAPFNALVVRQGVNSDLLHELASASSFFEQEMDDRINARLSESVLKFVSDEASTILRHGDFLFSEIVFRRQ